MTTLNTCAALLPVVRQRGPLVHHLTNYVTVNDCANITLAIGASPIMADAIEEAADIAAIASSLVLNIGTLNSVKVASMLAAGKSANAKGIPVVLDPVGAGASAFRTETVQLLLKEIRIAVLRGNISEIRAVSGLTAHTKGVDAAEKDQNADAGALVHSLARKLGCVVAVTGKTDWLSDGGTILSIANGHAALSTVSGTGCMCTSLIGSFAGAAPDKLLAAAAAGILCMGIAGEIAQEKITASGGGAGSCRVGIIDTISGLDEATLVKKGRMHETQG